MADLLDEDELLFAAEEEEERSTEEESGVVPWKVLLVDDERSVHEITRLALENFLFDGRPIQFLHAYSAAEACTMLEQHTDVAMMLLDVVMESDHAGLEVVEYVRNRLGNRFVRIILRTGQPGQAPEAQVIVDYDIDDYKEKTELTAQKLMTTMVTTLRAYQAIIQLEKSRQGLQKIINASASVFKVRSMAEFVEGILTQIVALTTRHDDALCAIVQREEEQTSEPPGFQTLAGTGCYSNSAGHRLETLLPETVVSQVAEADRIGRCTFFGNDCAIPFQGRGHNRGVIYLSGNHRIDDTDRNLIELFGNNISISTENIDLNHELQRTQEDVIHLLGTVSEFHSRETSQHVKRVGSYSALLGRLLGLPEEEIFLLEQAAPLHDMGKVGISDSILKKKGPLDEAEMSRMREHAQIGYDILRLNPNRPVLHAASIIAHEHHEKWDGSGYPRGLQGKEIHLYGRIAAIADVFDALASVRCYKPAWDLHRVRQEFEQQRGHQFDPELTDLLLNQFERFAEIFDRLPDK